MKRAVVSVINDLVTDQRVHRTCVSLVELGYEVTLVGRKLPDSLPLKKQVYKCKRMNLLFKKGPLFYAEFNVRLFLFLLFRRTSLLFSNDLDTLLPNVLIKKLKSVELVYDSHEYFTEVPELINRPTIQKVWIAIEKWCLPKVDKMITVNDSIAGLFRDKYGVKCAVVRNVPIIKDLPNSEKDSFVILQGAGINVDRGGEELVEAMQFVDKAKLLIVGSGDAIPRLKQMVDELKLDNKVIFKGKVPKEELVEYTSKSLIGCSLDKDTNINYRYSLPNKLFDYLQSGCAIVCSDLVEVRKVVETYQVGLVLNSVTPKEIAEKINYLLDHPNEMSQYQSNSRKAAKELNWDKEKEKLLAVLR